MPDTKKKNKAASAKQKETALGDLQKITKALAASHKKTEEWSSPKLSETP